MKKREFEEIYNIMNNSGIEEKLAEQGRKSSMICKIFLAAFTIACIIICLGVKSPILVYGLFFGMLCFLLYYLFSYGDYKELYNELVVEKLVNLYNENFKFSSTSGIAEKDYLQSDFKHTDDFYSRDLIEGIINDEYKFQMAEVQATKKSYADSKERFIGLFGVVELNETMPFEMYIVPDDFRDKYETSRVELESIKFEKSYDVFTTDKVLTMEILTSEVIESFNRFKEEINRNMVIHVKNNRLYFKIFCGFPFPGTFGNELSHTNLYYCYRIIDYPVTIISKMLENATRVKMQ